MNSASHRLFFDFARLSPSQETQEVLPSVVESAVKAEALRDPMPQS